MAIEDKLLEIAAYTLPAFITGGVAFVMMQKFAIVKPVSACYDIGIGYDRCL